MNSSNEGNKFVFGRGKLIKLIDYNNLSEDKQLEIYKKWIIKSDKFEYVNKNSLDFYLKFKIKN